ncbi:MAG TPA: hypothetical protein VE172_16910 [Stackebrandtia sp.]|jgi:AAA+ ATPase superfamily predicted ATPase|uniref:AAA family ATPase n=1 Tax=Stackebrandtia sp. TaxID=2023065 RepID=UPI002D38F7C0|nr:hypothetical protein [Stackebrandtia sp.]HZE40484.1 hypothetical protein [Stackebrandtia sp.]
MPKPPEIFARDREWNSLDQVPSYPQLGIIHGRRHQGKTQLLRAVAKSQRGFYFSGSKATEAESLRFFRQALSDYLKEPVDHFPDWYDAMCFLFRRVRTRPTFIAIDDITCLAKESPELPSIIRREFECASQLRSPVLLVLSGSDSSVMTTVRHELFPSSYGESFALVMRPFDHRTAARFWGIDDPRLATQVNSIVGGTPAYRRFAEGDVPRGPDDIDDWVIRTLFDPTNALCHQPRHRIAEEIGGSSGYVCRSLLAAIALGDNTKPTIATHTGSHAKTLSHALKVLLDRELILKEPDVFRKNRPRYRVIDPVLRFYFATMRPQWSLIETGDGDKVWRDTRPHYINTVVRPHFAQLCRDYEQLAERLSDWPGVVGAGTVPDPRHRRPINIDVAVFGIGQPRRVLSLGQTNWNETMRGRHLEHLARAYELLGEAGYDVRDCVLTLYSGKGFEESVRDEDRVVTIGLDDLYEK